MVNEVFFDDFKITHIESPVVQVTDYYPFGLQHANSWTRNNSVKNNRLFNAGSELNEITDNYETYYRNYDPALGRFMAVDPMASSFTSWSPYNYAYNDPVYWNDPNGDCPNCTDFLSDILHQEALDDDGRGGNNGAGYGGGLGGNSSIAENYGRGGNSFSGWAPNMATALFSLNMSSFGGTWSNGGISYYPSNQQALNSGYWVDPPTTVTGNLENGTLTATANRSYWVPIGQGAQNGGITAYSALRVNHMTVFWGFWNMD